MKQTINKQQKGELHQQPSPFFISTPSSNFKEDFFEYYICILTTCPEPVPLAPYSVDTLSKEDHKQLPCLLPSLKACSGDNILVEPS